MHQQDVKIQIYQQDFDHANSFDNPYNDYNDKEDSAFTPHSNSNQLLDLKKTSFQDSHQDSFMNLLPKHSGKSECGNSNSFEVYIKQGDSSNQSLNKYE